jgi:hypothetical protein
MGCTGSALMDSRFAPKQEKKNETDDFLFCCVEMIGIIRTAGAHGQIPGLHAPRISVHLEGAEAVRLAGNCSYSAPRRTLQ